MIRYTFTNSFPPGNFGETAVSPEPQTFRSVHFPQDELHPVMLLIRTSSTRFLPLLFIGLTLGLTGYLRHQDATLFILVYLALTYSVSVLISLNRLQNTMAEVTIGEEAAIMRSIWDVASHKQPEMQWVTHFQQDGDDKVAISVGQVVYEMKTTDWPDGTVLWDAFRSAALRGSAPLVL